MRECNHANRDLKGWTVFFSLKRGTPCPANAPAMIDTQGAPEISGMSGSYNML